MRSIEKTEPLVAMLIYDKGEDISGGVAGVLILQNILRREQSVTLREGQ